MKTAHHHKHLTKAEFDDITNTIEYVRTNSMRQVSVLGYAQLNSPLAYEEWRRTANKMKGLLHHLKEVNLILVDFNNNPKHLKELFDLRERTLNSSCD